MERNKVEPCGKRMNTPMGVKYCTLDFYCYDCTIQRYKVDNILDRLINKFIGEEE